jgi:hypothetical protein
MTKEEALGKKLRALQALKGYDSRQMAVKLHMCSKTWLKRLSDPGSMTVEELVRAEKCFGASLLNTEVKA